MAVTDLARPLLDPRKFRDIAITAKGERRASVALTSLDTLWFNTGTLCNLTCANCYIESSPRNDRLVYLGAAEVGEYLDENRWCGCRYLRLSPGRWGRCKRDRDGF
jgi:hypothetical protein